MLSSGVSNCEVRRLRDCTRGPAEAPADGPAAQGDYTEGVFTFRK